jgi:hypothetical protein
MQDPFGYPPDPPPLHPVVQAVLEAALRQRGADQPIMPLAGGGAPFGMTDQSPNVPLAGGGGAFAPPHPQFGQQIDDGPVGENAQLGWGTAPPMDYGAPGGPMRPPDVGAPGLGGMSGEGPNVPPDIADRRAMALAELGKFMQMKAKLHQAQIKAQEQHKQLREVWRNAGIGRRRF